MPSTYTERNRLEQQAPGENNNTWGARLNNKTFAMTDQALDGITSFTLSGAKTLTTVDGGEDEARSRLLWITSGTGGDVTIPAVEKLYLVKNAASGIVTITLGSGTEVDVAAGTTQWVFTDGTNVYSANSAIGAGLAATADAAAARVILGLTKASTAQTRAADGDVVLIADNIGDASAIVSLTDAATVAVDWTSGINFDVTLAGNRALGNPSNVVVGTTRTIMVKGSDATDRTLTFGSNYKGYLPSLTDIDSTNYYLISLYAYSATHIVVSVIEGL